MKYCLTTTINHPLNLKHKDAFEDINFVFVNEGYVGINPLFENNEIVINLDKVESIISLYENKKEKNRSIDLTFGITNEEETSTKMMVLVELKLNCINPNNINKRPLEEKVEESSKVLGSSIPIYNYYIFIFQPNLVEEAKSRFFRMNPQIPSNYIVMDTHTLKATFFH